MVTLAPDTPITVIAPGCRPFDLFRATVTTAPIDSLHSTIVTSTRWTSHEALLVYAAARIVPLHGIIRGRRGHWRVVRNRAGPKVMGPATILEGPFLVSVGRSSLLYASLSTALVLYTT